MKKIYLTIFVTLIFISCGKKEEQIPDFEKPYRLTEKYDKIADPGLVYVCHITNSFVSVIDSKSNELIGKIPCGNGSSWICFTPDKTTGYITNYNSYNPTIFDKETMKLLKQ
jgi:hypothetical protein